MIGSKLTSILNHLVQYQRPVIIGTMLLLFLGIRIVHLTADPPMELPNGNKSTELFVEGAAKSQEARNKALFGEWQTNPADSYQFWRIQSPAWVYPLSLFFKAFGVGRAQLHLFSIITSMIGLFFVLVLAARRFSGGPLIMCGMFMVFNYYYIFYSRAGLLEPMVSSFFAATILFLFLSVRECRWLIAAQVTLCLAFLTKQSGIVLLPLYLIMMVWSIYGAIRRHESYRTWLLPIFSLCVLVVALALYVRQDGYLRTLEWNYGHVFFNRPSRGTNFLTTTFLGAFLNRISNWEMWYEKVWLLMPVALPLIVVELFRIAYQGIRKKQTSTFEILTSLWFLTMVGSLFITPLKSMRFFIMIIPPGALLAAGGFGTVLNSIPYDQFRWPREMILGALIFIFGATHGGWWLGWFNEPSYHIENTGEEITETIGNEDAVIVGKWAPPFVLGTPYKNYYIKTGFNDESRVIKKLGITHILLLKRKDWSYGYLKDAYPDIKKRRESIGKYKLWGKHRMRLMTLNTDED